MTDNNDNILDLDAMLPPSGVVTLGGKQYEVKPPSLKILPKISQNLDKLSKLEDNTDDPEKIAQALTDINDTIKLVIPELPDEVELNVDQATALIDFILKMITPPEAKKLAEQGISPSSKKKIGSVS